MGKDFKDGVDCCLGCCSQLPSFRRKPESRWVGVGVFVGFRAFPCSLRSRPPSGAVHNPPP